MHNLVPHHTYACTFGDSIDTYLTYGALATWLDDDNVEPNELEDFDTAVPTGIVFSAPIMIGMPF